MHSKKTFLHAEKLRDLNSSAVIVGVSVAEREILVPVVRCAVFVAVRADVPDDFFVCCGTSRVVTRFALFVVVFLDWILLAVRADNVLFTAFFSVWFLLIMFAPVSVRADTCLVVLRSRTVAFCLSISVERDTPSCFLGVVILDF